jgi:hypothetical protein
MKLMIIVIKNATVVCTNVVKEKTKRNHSLIPLWEFLSAMTHLPRHVDIRRENVVTFLFFFIFTF